jgi:hypothetical protein
MAELSGMRCRLHQEQTELRPLFGTQSAPICVAFVDLAGLARGVTDPPLIPEFSISTLCALSGAGCRSFEPRMSMRRSRPGATPVDHDEESIESVSRLAWRRVASFVRLPGIGQHGTTHQMAPINPRTSMPHSKRTRRTMMDSNTLQRNAHPVRHEAATHLFAIGQIVRLKGGFGLQSQSADTYRITATLPPQGDSQQYRIRNDDEHYERVARQDSLEPARILPVGPSGALIEGTFGAGQAIETQQLRDQKSRSRRRPSPSLKAQELG